MSEDCAAHDFRTYCCRKLERNLQQIVRCASLLTTVQIWQRPNEHSNAIGNLVIHLRGNVTQWIMGGIAGQAYARDREAEFAQRDPLMTKQIVGRLEASVKRAIEVISDIDAATLIERRSIQAYDVTVLQAILHVVEHFSWHTGQIVYAAKVILDVDLSLYDADGRLLDSSDADPMP